MFREFSCGCIIGDFVGRVSICPTHRPETADGVGGANSYPRGKITREYPANGMMPARWSGR